METIEQVMDKLKSINGFVAVGAFTANGEILGQVVSGSSNLNEIGVIANDVLLKAQEATDIMGVGRGNLVHVAAPKAHIFARCLNENTDFRANEAGRAHVHVVLVVEPEGNLGMAKMILEKVIQEMAPLLR